jgi:hypothetical protein
MDVQGMKVLFIIMTITQVVIASQTDGLVRALSELGAFITVLLLVLLLKKPSIFSPLLNVKRQLTKRVR